MMYTTSFGEGFGLIGSLFPIMFFLVFAAILGVFISLAVKGIRQYTKNEASPTLSVIADVVTKRVNVRHRQQMGNSMSHSSTDYYVTFQVETGDRMEFEMSGKEYGLLVEGDSGKLTFQGTRYLGFQRSAHEAENILKN